MTQQLISYLALAAPVAVALLAALRTWLVGRAQHRRLVTILAAERRAMVDAAAAYEAAAASTRETAAVEARGDG